MPFVHNVQWDGPCSGGKVYRFGTAASFEARAKDADAEAIRTANFKNPKRSQREANRAAKYRALIEPARAYWGEYDRVTEASGSNPLRPCKPPTWKPCATMLGRS